MSTSAHAFGPRGLDLANAEVTTPEEWEAWRESERQRRGYPLPSYELLGEFGRADAVKRWLAQVQQLPTLPETTPQTLRIAALGALHLFAITGYQGGVLFEIANAETAAFRRAEVVETLVVAFLQGPVQGTHAMADAVAERLRRYREPGNPGAYPDGWEVDPGAFASGLDFADPHLSAGELVRLERWYLAVTGEVPRSVSFLAVHAPRVLKAWRARFETAVQVMPKQMLPFLLLHYEAYRGREQGIREAALLARGLGVTRAQAAATIVWAMNHAGAAAVSTAGDAASALLQAW
jgi:hypothetical protein